mgnify:CR=1 FL=1
MATYKGRHCIAGTGATGAQGVQGNKGDKGDAATVAVSSTVTLAPGSQAKVENEGDSHNERSLSAAQCYIFSTHQSHCRRT